MLSIEDSISKAYYDDEDGFGSMNKTLTDAKRYNEKVSLENVRSMVRQEYRRQEKLEKGITVS
jgi:hypothetical protein